MLTLRFLQHSYTPEGENKFLKVALARALKTPLTDPLQDQEERVMNAELANESSTQAYSTPFLPWSPDVRTRLQRSQPRPSFCSGRRSESTNC